MKPFYKYIILLTLILTSFTLGVYSSDKVRKTIVKNIIKNEKINFLYDKNNDNISRPNIITKKLEESGFLEKDNLNLSNLFSAYSFIREEFYDIEGLKKQDLVDGAVKGLVESLGDKHSEFMSKKENIEFQKGLSGDFEGIGAFIEKLSFGIKIERIVKGSPAEKFGVMQDDVVIEANGFKLEGLSTHDAVKKIKGPAGTKVILKILRIGEKEPIEIEVIRGKIKIPSIETKYFEKNKIGYISLSVFGRDSSKEFNLALKNLEEKQIEGLIIDLRSNPGGLLMEAVEILSRFIEEGKTVVVTKYKSKFQNKVYPSFGLKERFKKKIIILINGNSASASEITAGALRDYKKAILVGTKSYGKGSVQTQFDMLDGSMLKLTIAKWFTPLDKNIDGEGIEPDIEIKIKKEDYDFDECIKSGRCKKGSEKKDFKVFDRQLDEAKNILKKFIENENLQLVVDEENERLGNKIDDKKIEEKK